jgi:hypothetical protein
MDQHLLKLQGPAFIRMADIVDKKGKEPFFFLIKCQLDISE